MRTIGERRDGTGIAASDYGAIPRGYVDSTAEVREQNACARPGHLATDRRRVHKLGNHGLELGYRHIDTAEGYGNHEQVRAGIEKSGSRERALHYVKGQPFEPAQSRRSRCL